MPGQFKTSSMPDLLSANKSSAAFFKPVVQAKLSINQPNDVYEQEADAVAEKVMRMPVTEDTFFKPAAPVVQLKCTHCEEEEKKINRKEEEGEETTAGSDLENYIGNINGNGTSLSDEVRNFYEPRLGHDFSQVKIHTDTVAAKSAQSINALAYTSGNNIVFNEGQYSPNTDSGKRLLGHELAHVIQQSADVQPKKIQRVYRLNELYQNGAPLLSNPVSSNPDVSFYQGSAANTTSRKAMIIAGIHGNEPSARALGHEIKNQLDTHAAHTDFHTLLVPQVNPSPASNRSAGTGSTGVSDLNREFGSGYTSPSPIANKVTQMVNEFDPERVMSIHAISNPALGGVFLDPVNSGTYPAVGTAATNAAAFTGDQRNLDAMLLADSMISAIGNTASTPGNTPTSVRPPSHYPGAGAGASPSSLIYPLQGGISTSTAGPTSLGVWVSSLGKPIYTIEIPGYNAPGSVWQTFLPAIWEFLRIPQAAPAAGTGGSISGLIDDIIDWVSELIDDIARLLERLSQIPDPLPREARPAGLNASCLTFPTRADLDARKAHWAGVISSIAAGSVNDVVNWIIGISLPRGSRAAITESVNQKDCMLSALSISAATAGSPIQHRGTPNWSSGRRDFAGQNRIWQEKFNFTRATPFDRISPNARTICGGLLLPSETKWNTREARHRRCWGVAPLAGTVVPPFPAGTRSLTDDEKQMEILQASSAPGISRHHWGTDFDLFSDEPGEWETSGTGRNFADEYRWLLSNASMYGFIQAFTPLSSFRQLGYMEERWHWSYWPVAQALLEFVSTHETDVQAALTAQWGTAPQFSFIQNHWREFMNNVNQTP